MKNFAIFSFANASQFIFYCTNVIYTLTRGHHYHVLLIAEYVNNDDIELIAKALQDSWLTLTDIGVAQTELDLLKSSSDDLEESSEYLLKDLCSSHLQSSSFMDLVENLEGMGRSDVADSLIDSRMKTTGITL